MNNERIPPGGGYPSPGSETGAGGSLSASRSAYGFPAGNNLASRIPPVQCKDVALASSVCVAIAAVPVNRFRRHRRKRFAAIAASGAPPSARQVKSSSPGNAG
jgi:hypothetical protein